MEKWFIKNRKADYKRIASQFRIHEVTARLAVNRGVSSVEQMKEYLYPNLEHLEAPEHMKDLEKACKILIEKIKQNSRIRVIGDYDVDGVMSTYILTTALSQCHANVDYEIPDRIKDGYGVNVSIIEAAYRDGIDTILTCDNGIAAFEQIERAKQLGMTVIITDHHDIPFEIEKGEKIYKIPQADAVVNPKQPDCAYRFKNMCGAVVAYKLVSRLYEIFKIKGEKDFLEFAAIATVCDVMELVHENRTIVQYGLKAASNSKNLGLKALLKINNLEETELTSYHAGFVIGPCINASGRLESAKLALKMLFSENSKEAYSYANKLKELNEERKSLTEVGIIDGCKQAEERYVNDFVLVIYLEDCHESIAGIIAGRVREKYHKPVLILTESKESIKGSGRSIEGYNMFEKLTECKELLEKFGGHPMAAGLSLKKENMALLRKKLNERSGLTKENLIKKVTFDMVLPFQEVDFRLLDEIKLLEPFGKGNEKPSFAMKNVKLINGRVLGKSNNVLRLTVGFDGTNSIYIALLFGNVDLFEDYLVEKYGICAMETLVAGHAQEIYLDFVFYPDRNDYKGKSTVQFIIQHFR